MRSNHIITLVAAISVGVGSLVFAGCGGGGSKSSAPQPAGGATPVSSHGQRSSKADCTSLGRIPDDLALASTGFDYVRDRDFLDGYADRAPDEIGDSVQRLRDILDKFASAAEKAGLKPNAVPLPDQADEIMSALSSFEDEQAANGRAYQAVEAWAMNGCEA
jgi:hypothetical protein